MKKVLIVKLSSMGDLVQALPAVSDAARALPGIEFDWVVDESFAEVPQWHPAVNEVVISAHRRWRKNFLKSVRTGELRRFGKNLRSREYDLVIDAQSGLKSALVTWMARGAKCGADKQSVHEYGAHWAYSRHCALTPSQLAVDRLRQLFSCALDYPLPDSTPDFALKSQTWPKIDDLPEQPYLVAVTNASWSNKCWPDSHWKDFLDMAVQGGYKVFLPWGSEAEQNRALSLAAAAGIEVQVLPRLSLTELLGVLQNSAGAVCNDTGLAHMAAALDLPCVTLYGPTDPGLIGATGRYSRHLSVASFPCAPCYRRYCDWPGDEKLAAYKGPEAQCLKSIGAAQVWQALVEQQEAAARGVEPLPAVQIC